MLNTSVAQSIVDRTMSVLNVNVNIMDVNGTVIASGDQFISAEEDRERIVSTFGAVCCEMEGAAIAHVAFLNRLPFLIIRAISDGADDGALMDYPTFEKHAAESSIKLCLGMLENYLI